VTAPAEIWIDERVVRTMKTEPDEEAAERGVVQVRYISAERVGELMHDQGNEFFIQIDHAAGGIIFALTNYGRIFRQSVGAPEWEIVAVPDFATAEPAT